MNRRSFIHKGSLSLLSVGAVGKMPERRNKSRLKIDLCSPDIRALTREKMNSFTDQIFLESNGSLVVEVSTKRQDLPNERNYIQAVKSGELDMALGMSHLHDLLPPPQSMAFSNMPYGQSVKSVRRWLETEGVEFWNNAYEPHGLGVLPCGQTLIFGLCSHKKLQSIADFKNIVVLANPAFFEITKKLAVKTGPRKSKSAIQQFKDKEVDAVLVASPAVALKENLHRISPYIYTSPAMGHYMNFEIVFNLKKIASLGAANEKTLFSAVQNLDNEIGVAQEKVDQQANVEIRSQFPNKIRNFSPTVEGSLKKGFSSQFKSAFTDNESLKKLWSSYYALS